MNETLLGISMNHILICGQCHFNSFLFFSFLLLLLWLLLLVVEHLWCWCRCRCVSRFAAVGFFFLLLVILMIYWMCWHPLLIKIIIHLPNTLRAAYSWIHTYLAHSLVHPIVHPSIRAFFFLLQIPNPNNVRTILMVSMFTFCLFHLENFIPFYA